MNKKLIITAALMPLLLVACGEEKAAYQAWGDKYPPVECSFEDYKRSKPRGQDCIDHLVKLIGSMKPLEKQSEEFKNDEYFQKRKNEILEEEKEAYLTSQTAAKEIRKLVKLVEEKGQGNKLLFDKIIDKDLRIKNVEESLNKLIFYRGTGKI